VRLIGAPVGAVIGAPSSSDAHHVVGALQEKKADQGLIPVQTHPAASCSSMEGVQGPHRRRWMFPWPSARRDRLFVDFTQGQAGGDHSAGEPFPHLRSTYPWPESCWAYARVVHGGESFVALSEGLNAWPPPAVVCPESCRTIGFRLASRNS